METVTDFVLGGSKITADGDCSREFKRCMLLVPGSSPGGSREFEGGDGIRVFGKNTYLITDIERLEMDSAVGRLVEKKRLNNLDYVE